MSAADSLRPVLILGAGVNGACVARELVLNGVPVWIADADDIAAGATSKSSRLIHGGLRYLEYGEFPLVRESLAERDRLRRLAPQFVEPLRLFIPITSRTSGLAASALKFVGGARIPGLRRISGAFGRERGLWLVRTGLALYDRFASNADFPPHTLVPAREPAVPEITPRVGRWLCAYSDGQMRFPERFVVALLQDAARAAAERRVEFRVLTHCTARVVGNEVVLTPSNSVDACPGSSSAFPSPAPGTQHQALTPSLLVNATGAWGDFTLRELGVPAPPLFGGTKGSHIVTWNAALVRALHGHGVYAEAPDDRLVFVLPFGDGVLVGTTDERFADRPERAVATDPEIDYLLGMVNELFPHVGLTRDDVVAHCCGVRPLPRVTEGATAAISRDHDVVEHRAGTIPVLTLVGGKLTTCRAFGEEVADDILNRLDVIRTAGTRDRIIPGGEDYPRTRDELDDRLRSLAESTGLTPAQVRAAWELLGTHTPLACEADRTSGDAPQVLEGTDLPLSVVRWIIDHEWVATLSDLVERRLMLVFARRLSVSTLRHLTQCLADAGRLDSDAIDTAITDCIARLRSLYGRRIE